MERYILGSEVLTISDQEPTAGQVEVEPRLLGGFLSAGWWPTELRRLPVPLGVRGLAHELSRAGAADLGQALPPAREGVGAMKHAVFWMVFMSFHQISKAFHLSPYFACFTCERSCFDRQPAIAVAPLLLWEAPRCREKRFL